VRVFRKNADGSRGAVLWEVGAVLTLSESLDLANLKYLSDYFFSKQTSKGQQVYLWDDL
jgi:hypothetical protein